jgi:L-amino acid N-acyltransferase YncA
MKIELLTKRHWPQVKAIYESGVLTENANFTHRALKWEEWDNAHVKNCRLVATENDTVLGWAALAAVSDNCVFTGVAEDSVYVAENSRGKGIGKQLLKEIVKLSEENNFWTLESRIFPENLASIKIHEENGFRIVGSRERIGQLHGIWRDTLLLERRSIIVGI